MTGHTFIYPPQAAVIFAPWAILPAAACEVIYRLCAIGVVAAAVSRLSRVLGGDSRILFVTCLVSAILSIGTARVGQATLIITGFMVLGIVEITEKRWWRATIFLTLALIFKPHAFVLLLLAAAIFPQMSYRLGIALVFAALMPFATQQWDYVISQYQDFARSFTITFHVGETTYWAQLFGMLQVAGIDVPSTLRTEIRLIAAAATLFACLVASWRLAPQRAAFYLYAFSAAYVMLFNPRTEGNTYCMIAPVYGILLAEALIRRKNRAESVFLIMATALTLLHFEFGRLITPVPREVWVAPLVCLLVTIFMTVKFCQEVMNQEAAVISIENGSSDVSMPTNKWSAAA